MLRRSVLAAALTLSSAGIVASATPALAGGGCHAGVTTAREGSTVAMADACFTPTILKVDPGETVRFVNEDAFAHNVTANLWGHFEDLNEGDDFRVAFDEPGVYPYACTLHPGMSGAIVVGDGTGAGNGAVIEVPDAAATTGPTGTSGSDGGSTSPVSAVEQGGNPSALPWIGGAALGLVLGGAAGRIVRRRPER